MASVVATAQHESFTTSDYRYTFFNTNTRRNRVLTFSSVNMKGLVDLTSYEKATGETIWPCCAILADYLSKHFETHTHGNKVLELGCGLGVLGAICAAKIGNNNNNINTTLETSVGNNSSSSNDSSNNNNTVIKQLLPVGSPCAVIQGLERSGFFEAAVVQ